MMPHEHALTRLAEVQILHSHARQSLLCVKIIHWICLPRRQHLSQYAIQPCKVPISWHNIILDPISVQNNLEAKKAQAQLHIQPSFYGHHCCCFGLVTSSEHHEGFKSWGGCAQVVALSYEWRTHARMSSICQLDIRQRDWSWKLCEYNVLLLPPSSLDVRMV